MYKRFLEDPYHALAQQHPELFRGGNTLDIGANIGYTSLVFSRAIDPNYKVSSFEPERFNFQLLERLARSPKAHGRVIPIQSAVGDQDGAIALWENERHHGDHRIMTEQFRKASRASNSVTVPLLRIDTFVERQEGPFPVRFIKVDVQGYELPVCKGMERTLTNNPGAILALEYMPEGMRELGFQPEALLGWLREREFQIYTLDKGGTLRPGIPDLSGKQNYVDLLFSRDRLSV